MSKLKENFPCVKWLLPEIQSLCANTTLYFMQWCLYSMLSFKSVICNMLKKMSSPELCTYQRANHGNLPVSSHHILELCIYINNNVIFMV